MSTYTRGFFSLIQRKHRSFHGWRSFCFYCSSLESVTRYQIQSFLAISTANFDVPDEVTLVAGNLIAGELIYGVHIVNPFVEN
jgi:hypothetical protein